MCRRKECEISIFKNVIRSLSEENLNRISLHVILSPASGTKYNIQGKITHKFISSHTTVTEKTTTTTKNIQNDSHMKQREAQRYILYVCIKIKYENKSIKEFLMVYHKF